LIKISKIFGHKFTNQKSLKTPPLKISFKLILSYCLIKSSAKINLNKRPSSLRADSTPTLKTPCTL